MNWWQWAVIILLIPPSLAVLYVMARPVIFLIAMLVNKKWP
jgi:hypothetical protein